MRLCTITTLLLFLVYQVKAACVQDLMRLFTHDVSKVELEMNITIVDIINKIQDTKEGINDMILNTKHEIQSEKEVLQDLEAEAFGESLVKKKSIADCLQDDRIHMKIINTTESVIYRMCRADLSLYLVKLSIVSIEQVSKKLELDLDVCINDNNINCEKEVACIIKTLEEINDELDAIKFEVERRLNEVKDTSQICAEGKKGLVISLIKEQESHFKYCVQKILKDV